MSPLAFLCPGCGVIVAKRGRCTTCRAPQEAKHTARRIASGRSRRWWSRFRLVVIARDGGACVDCGSTEHLQADYLGEGPHVPDVDLYETRCRRCHGVRHGGGRP